MSVIDARRSGVLLHLSSLPDSGGRGALGEQARRFVDLLADSGFTVWQMLPVGPPDAAGSPYSSKSVHAGNPGFIDWQDPSARQRPAAEYRAFIEEQRQWLQDEALFVALQAERRGHPWWQWPAELRDREPAALEEARRRHRQSMEAFAEEQFLFQRQWRALRNYAHDRGVRLFGDLPIYVAHDSAEVWTHRDDYQLDARGMPTVVAGVPPDYFSVDGQLWGNPLYDWDRMQANGFASWVARMQTQLSRFDLVRIDHFRGCEAYWAVPAGALTAREGRWCKAGGEALLRELQSLWSPLPLVAEELGIITPPVVALRERFGLAGMRVLQFAFDGTPDNPHLPANYVRNSVVYTGTHDNDTTLGWYRALDPHTRGRVDEYFGGQPMPEALEYAALSSVANLAVIPLQDLLGLGSEARMNTPGTVRGNWSWTFSWEQIPPGFVAHWRSQNIRYERSKVP